MRSGARAGPVEAGAGGRRMKCGNWPRSARPGPSMGSEPCRPHGAANPSGEESPGLVGGIVARGSVVGTAVVIRSPSCGPGYFGPGAPPPNGSAALVSRLPAFSWLRRTANACTNGDLGRLTWDFIAKSVPVKGIRRRDGTGTLRPIGPQGAASPHAPGSHRRAGGPCRKPFAGARFRFSARRGRRSEVMNRCDINNVWNLHADLC
jgi:hypothetical protein